IRDATVTGVQTCALPIFRRFAATKIASSQKDRAYAPRCMSNGTEALETNAATTHKAKSAGALNSSLPSAVILPPRVTPSPRPRKIGRATWRYGEVVLTLT